MAHYTYRVTLRSKTASREVTQKHDYPFLSSAHHACVQHVSASGKERYTHAKIDHGVQYSAESKDKTATIVWQRA